MEYQRPEAAAAAAGKCAAAAADAVDASIKDVVKTMQDVEVVAERAKEVRLFSLQLCNCIDRYTGNQYV